MGGLVRSFECVADFEQILSVQHSVLCTTRDLLGDVERHEAYREENEVSPLALITVVVSAPVIVDARTAAREVRGRGREVGEDLVDHLLV